MLACNFATLKKYLANKLLYLFIRPLDGHFAASLLQLHLSLFSMLFVILYEVSISPNIPVTEV